MARTATAIVYLPGLGEYEIPITRYGSHPESGAGNWSGELKTDYGMIAFYLNDTRA